MAERQVRMEEARGVEDIVSTRLTDPQSLQRKGGLVVMVYRATVPATPSLARRPRLRDLASSPAAARAIQRVRPAEAGQNEDEFNSTI